MSISNLTEPNNLDLYCNTISPKSGILSNVYTEIVDVEFDNVGDGKVQYTLQDGGIYPAIVKRDNEFLNITGIFRILVSNNNENDFRVNMNVPYPVDTKYNRINYINAMGSSRQDTLNNEGFIGMLKSNLSTEDIINKDVIKINYDRIFPSTNTYNNNQFYTFHYNINCRLYSG
jgi:hypothetical protein